MKVTSIDAGLAHMYYMARHAQIGKRLGESYEAAVHDVINWVTQMDNYRKLPENNPVKKRHDPKFIEVAAAQLGMNYRF